MMAQMYVMAGLLTTLSVTAITESPADLLSNRQPAQENQLLAKIYN